MNVMTSVMPSVASTPDSGASPDSPLTPLGAQVFAAMFAALIPKVQVPPPPPVATQELAETGDSDAPDTGKVGTDDGSDDAGVELAMETAIAALTAGRLSINDMARQLGTLDPALQEKLLHVVQSMKDAGHDVSIADPPSSLPGSQSSSANADPNATADAVSVDLLVDGKAGQADAYGKLLTLLHAEGLHTLAGTDPRELQQFGVKVLQVQHDATPASVRPVVPVSPPPAAPTPTVSKANGAATSASTVATGIVARADKSASTASSPPPQSGSAIVALAAAAFGEMSGDGSGHKQRDPGADLKAPALDMALSRGGTYGVIASTTTARGGTGETLSALPLLDTAQRVLDATPDTPARPLSQITMSLDSSDRVQVVMRGPAVTAAIDVVDPTVAQQLVAREGELTRALARHSLDMDTMTVRASESGDGHLDSRQRGQRDPRRDKNPNGGSFT